MILADAADMFWKRRMRVKGEFDRIVESIDEDLRRPSYCNRSLTWVKRSQAGNITCHK
jgi:hypothetical protein